jgi:hypothetical protein
MVVVSAFRVIRDVITDRAWSPPGLSDAELATLFRRLLLAGVAGIALCLAAFACAFAALFDGNAGYLYDTGHAMVLAAAGGFGVVVVHTTVAARRLHRRGGGEREDDTR